MKTITKKKFLEYLKDFDNNDLFYIETDCYYEPEVEFALEKEPKVAAVFSIDNPTEYKRAYKLACVRSVP